MIALRIIENPGQLYRMPKGEAGIQPGDMWRDPVWDTPERECWAIVLPNGTVFRTTETAGGSGQMWDVTGEPPDVTISPSIDDRDPQHPWHGFIRNGVLDPS